MRSLANKEIAVLLSLSESTVKFHLSALFAKFGVRGRSELALEVTRRTLGPRAEPQPLTTRGERTCADAPPSHGALRVRPIAATSVIGSFRPNA